MPADIYSAQQHLHMAYRHLVIHMAYRHLVIEER